MDPLSLAASIIAVIQTATKTASALQDLKELWSMDLPGKLSSMNNQVADLKMVLGQMEAMTSTVIAKGNQKDIETEEAQHVDNVDPPFLSPLQVQNVQNILKYCDENLENLRAIIKKINTPNNTGIPHSRFRQLKAVHSWRQHLPELNDIHARITGFKASLNVIIGRTSLSVYSCSLFAS